MPLTLTCALDLPRGGTKCLTPPQGRSARGEPRAERGNGERRGAGEQTTKGHHSRRASSNCGVPFPAIAIQRAYRKRPEPQRRTTGRGVGASALQRPPRPAPPALDLDLDRLKRCDKLEVANSPGFFQAQSRRAQATIHRRSYLAVYNVHPTKPLFLALASCSQHAYADASNVFDACFAYLSPS